MNDGLNARNDHLNVECKFDMIEDEEGATSENQDVNA
jgi:hypothetical protein